MADQTKTGIVGTIVIAAIGVVGPIIRRKIEEEMKALEAKAASTQSWGDDAAVKLANILMAVDE
jgi:hypothetical protein